MAPVAKYIFYIFAVHILWPWKANPEISPNYHKFITEINILQHLTNCWKQEIIILWPPVESFFAELSESIWIPSSLMTFATIRILVLMRLRNCSIHWARGKIVTLIRFISGRPVWMFMASCILLESGWFSSPTSFYFYTGAVDDPQSMEWPAFLACSDTAGMRSQDCTDYRCSFSLVPSLITVLPM